MSASLIACEEPRDSATESAPTSQPSTSVAVGVAGEAENDAPLQGKIETHGSDQSLATRGLDTSRKLNAESMPAPPAQSVSSKAPGGPLHPSEIFRERALRRVQMGRAPEESLSEGNAGLPSDPEVDSVVRGRRIVDEIPEADFAFDDGYDSPEELAQAMLRHVYSEDRSGLMSLALSKQNFLEYIWPEFPQSRPGGNVSGPEAWMLHRQKSLEGVSNAMASLRGEELVLRSVEFERGLAQYKNFNLYLGTIFTLTDSRGEIIEFRFAPTLIERFGRWKVFAFEEL